MHLICDVIFVIVFDLTVFVQGSTVERQLQIWCLKPSHL